MTKTLLFVASSLLLLASCSPGEDTGGNGGTGGGGAGGAGGTGATGGAVTCSLYKTPMEVEEKLIIPKCGKNNDCHSGMTWKPYIKDLGKTVEAVLDQKGMFCTADKFVNKAEPAKSIMVIKVNAPNNMVKCPSTSFSGLRMPPNDNDLYKEPPLTKAEIDCVTWWVYQVAK